MQTTCVRQGQIEIGIIEHEGREFSALGATVQGRHVTGYTKLVDGDIHLSTWCGKPMLASRCEVVERFWTGTMALMFRLPRGRFIVGYALADDGMLFRGELLTNSDYPEDDRYYSGSGQVLDLDHLMIYGAEGSDCPFPCRYFGDELPEEGVVPTEFEEVEE